MDDRNHEKIMGDTNLRSREIVPLSRLSQRTRPPSPNRRLCAEVKKGIISYSGQNSNSRGSHQTKSIMERILEYISAFFSRKNESETITKPHRSRGKNQESEANGMRSVSLLTAIPGGVEDAPKFKGKKIGGARRIIASSSL